MRVRTALISVFDKRNITQFCLALSGMGPGLPSGFAGAHSICVVPNGDGTVSVYDPLAPEPGTPVESAAPAQTPAADESTVGTGTSIALGCIAGSVVLIVVAVFLSLVVLAQRAKSDAGLSSGMGGGMMESAFGPDTGNVLSRLTIKAIRIVGE